ncbi:lipocalin-like domain-containing protein [Actinocorallia lasiicapitis]
MITPRSLRRVLAALPLAAAVLFAPIAAVPASADTVGVVVPKDEAPHDNIREWWYYTGHLTGLDSSGKIHRYGYELTVFRKRLVFPSLAAYPGNLAITDLTDDKFKWEASVAVQPDNLLAGGGYDITVNDWKTSGKNGSAKIDAAFSDGAYKLKLNLKQTKPPALHGNYKGVKGLVDYGQWGETYYYSYTDLATTGVVYDHGKPIVVVGDSWMDHQWGDFKPAYGGWDWHSIKLANGSQYMVYLINDGHGNVVRTVATLIRPNGTTVNLDPSQVSNEALGSWTSPVTGLTYSSGWKVKVPGGSFTVLPKRKDQEVAWPDAPGGGYWEGACSVIGTLNGSPVIGQAYTEITTPDLVF